MISFSTLEMNRVRFDHSAIIISVPYCDSTNYIMYVVTINLPIRPVMRTLPVEGCAA